MDKREYVKAVRRDFLVAQLAALERQEELYKRLQSTPLLVDDPDWRAEFGQAQATVQRACAALRNLKPPPSYRKAHAYALGMAKEEEAAEGFFREFTRTGQVDKLYAGAERMNHATKLVNGFWFYYK